MVTMAASASNNIANVAARSPDVTTTTIPKRPSENRRSNKPIMEKKRRARINNSLNELKSLILDAMKKDPARHSKLEKADILEMAVKHLETLHKQQAAIPNLVDKYRAGFSECASEVNRYPHLDPIVRRRLVQHLNECLSANGVSTSSTNELSSRLAQHHQHHQNVQVKIVPSSHDHSSMGVSPPNGFYAPTSVQLVPTRLSNGEYALIFDPPVSSPVPNGGSSGSPPHQQERHSVSPTHSSSSWPPSPPSPPRTTTPHMRSASTDSGHSTAFERLSYNTLARSSSMDDVCSVRSGSGYSSSSPCPSSHDDGYGSSPLALVVREDRERGCWRPWF